MISEIQIIPPVDLDTTWGAGNESILEQPVGPPSTREKLTLGQFARAIAATGRL
jgi:hypothetical protein